MININNFYYMYISDFIYSVNYAKYIKEIYKNIYYLNYIYYDFTNWFRKMEKELITNKREILMCLYKEILIGFIILKKDKEEQKICTIYVKEKYRNMGIGKRLMIKGFGWLNNEKPLMTINDLNMHYYFNIIKYFGFKLDIIDKKNGLEYMFNIS